MITGADLALVKLALGMLATWFFVFWLWRDYRLDALREDLFAVRDELFLYAATGSVGFDHPAYSILRDLMNGMIRYAHQFTLARLLLALTQGREKPRAAELIRWEEAVRSLESAEARERLSEFQATMTLIILKHMILRSFLLSFLTLPFRIAGKTREITKRWLRESPELIPVVEQLESEAAEADSGYGGSKEAVVAGAR